MVTFFDLPDNVRKVIYIFHLCHYGKDITAYEHRQLAKIALRGLKRELPLLVTNLPGDDVDIYEEAAPIYYRENSFRFCDTCELMRFVEIMEKRSAQLVRKITFAYDVKHSSYPSWDGGYFTEASQAFRRLHNFTGLEDLDIIVDEARLVKYQCSQSKDLRRFEPEQEIPRQLNLKVLTVCGMDSLRELHGIRKVTFIDGAKAGNRTWGGPIPGGILDSVVAPEMMSELKSLADQTRGKAQNDAFPFLRLAPELRNRIYKGLLIIPGGITPINSYPTSAASSVYGSGRLKEDKRKIPQSALNLLLTNRQIHDEAFGIFYHLNHFIFFWPLHFQSFVSTLSTPRKNCIREITIWYKNHSEGNFNSMDFTFTMLAMIPSLKSLHVVFEDFKVTKSRTRPVSVEELHELPGISTLKKFRGLEELTIRCLWAERGSEYLSTGEIKFRQKLLHGFASSLNKAMRVGKNVKIKREASLTISTANKGDRWKRELGNLAGN